MSASHKNRNCHHSFQRHRWQSWALGEFFPLTTLKSPFRGVGVLKWIERVARDSPGALPCSWLPKRLTSLRWVRGTAEGLRAHCPRKLPPLQGNWGRCLGATTQCKHRWIIEEKKLINLRRGSCGWSAGAVCSLRFGLGWLIEELCSWWWGCARWPSPSLLWNFRWTGRVDPFAQILILALVWCMCIGRMSLSTRRLQFRICICRTVIRYTAECWLLLERILVCLVVLIQRIIQLSRAGDYSRLSPGETSQPLEVPEGCLKGLVDFCGTVWIKTTLLDKKGYSFLFYSCGLLIGTIGSKEFRTTFQQAFPSNRNWFFFQKVGLTRGKKKLKEILDARVWK